MPRRYTTESSSGQLVYGISLVVVGIAVIGLVRAVIPLVPIALPLLGGWCLWNGYCKAQKQRQEWLDTTFYRLLQAYSGRVTVLDFAMTAGLPAPQARQYLDSRAKEFAAHFEVTEQGNVIYCFHTLGGAIVEAPSPPDPSPSEEKISQNSLSQADLARRLNVSASAISRKKLASDFPTWSQSRDPEGTTWSYEAETQRFLRQPSLPLLPQQDLQDDLQDDRLQRRFPIG